MLKMTDEQAAKLKSMQTQRFQMSGELHKITGLQGNGAEMRFRAHVEAEYDFRESLGEKGIMR